eukprot:g9321.t2
MEQLRGERLYSPKIEEEVHLPAFNDLLLEAENAARIRQNLRPFAKGLRGWAQRAFESAFADRKFVWERMEVDRHGNTSVFQQTFEEFLVNPDRFMAQWEKINFAGEAGIDYGGLKKEWLQLVLETAVNASATKQPAGLLGARDKRVERGRQCRNAPARWVLKRTVLLQSGRLTSSRPLWRSAAAVLLWLHRPELSCVLPNAGEVDGRRMEVKLQLCKRMDQAIRARDELSATICLDEALRLWIDLEAATFSPLIDLAAQEGDLQRAEQWFENAQLFSVKLDDVEFNSLVTAAANQGNLSAAEAWYDKAVAAGIQPDAVTLTALMRAAAAVKDRSRAKEWYRAAPSLRVAPNEVMHSCLLHALRENATDSRSGTAIGRKPNKSEVEECFAAGRLQPNAVMYNTIIDAMARAGEMKSAEEYFQHDPWTELPTASGEGNPAIYQEDFEATEGAWRIRLPDYGCTLKVQLDAQYPEKAPPVPALEFEPWPAGGDAFAKRMEEELLKLWSPGESCLYQWVEHLREALDQTGPADAAPAGAAPADAGPVSAVAAQRVPLTAELRATVGPSLTKAGFTEWSEGLFAESEKGVTLELREELNITVDGVDAEDLMDWASMQLSEPELFGLRLLEWVTAQRSPEPGFLEEEPVEGGPDFLPSPEETGTKRARPLLVYTWGKALRKSAPGDSEHNFNAGILNGRGGGADLKSMNGLWDEVQSNVASCGGEFRPDAATFGALINGAAEPGCSGGRSQGVDEEDGELWDSPQYGQLERFVQSLSTPELFEEMVQQRHAPDAVTLISLIGFLGKPRVRGLCSELKVDYDRIIREPVVNRAVKRADPHFQLSEQYRRMSRFSLRAQRALGATGTDQAETCR